MDNQVGADLGDDEPVSDAEDNAAPRTTTREADAPRRWGVAVLAFACGMALTGWGLTGFFYYDYYQSTQALRDSQNAAPSVAVEVTKQTLHHRVPIIATPMATMRTEVVRDGGVVTDGGPGQVTFGKTLLEVDGRPVIAVVSDFPFYRDLKPGDSGRDVKVLTQNLSNWGYLKSTTDTFTPAVEKAVAKLYKDRGYSAPVQEALEPGSADPQEQDQAGATEGMEPAEPVVVKQAWVPLAEILGLPSNLGGADVALPTVGSRLSEDNAVRITSGSNALRVGGGGGLTAELTRQWGKQSCCQLITRDGASYTIDSFHEETSAEGGAATILVVPDFRDIPDQVRGFVALDATPAEVMAVPKMALFVDGDETYVRRVTDDGPERVVVQTGFEGQDLIEVSSSDLAVGDQILADE